MYQCKPPCLSGGHIDFSGADHDTKTTLREFMYLVFFHSKKPRVQLCTYYINISYKNK